MMEEHIVFNSEDVSKNKVYGILSYIGILFIIPLLCAKDSQYSKFHANQGLVLFITEIALNIVGFILIVVCGIATFGLLTNLITKIVRGVITLISLVYFVLGVVNACSGEPRKLPIIGEITLIR